MHCTAGCHPTSTSEIDKHPGGLDGYLEELAALVEEDRGEGGSKRIISIGEIGLGESEHFGRFCVQRASESPCHVVIELS